MTRNPSTAHVSLMRELQTLIHRGSDRNGLPGGVLLSYSGTLSQKSLESVVHLTENAVSQCGSPRAELLRAKIAVTDCLKNILSHGLIDENGETLYYIVIDCADNGITIRCGGYIDDNHSSSLSEKVNEINKMSISDLRKRSIELLCKSDGLGNNNSELCLVNISLNCKRPFDFSISTTEDEINIFNIDLIVNQALA